MKECIARLLIFSGRPDPTWRVEESTLKELRDIWNSLTPYYGEPLSPTSLGYRGCIVSCNNGTEWFVFQNMISFTINGKTEIRTDKNKEIEDLILDSAPQDIVPPSLRQIIHE